MLIQINYYGDTLNRDRNSTRKSISLKNKKYFDYQLL